MNEKKELCHNTSYPIKAENINWTRCCLHGWNMWNIFCCCWCIVSVDHTKCFQYFKFESFALWTLTIIQFVGKKKYTIHPSDHNCNFFVDSIFFNSERQFLFPLGYKHIIFVSHLAWSLLTTELFIYSNQISSWPYSCYICLVFFTPFRYCCDRRTKLSIRVRFVLKLNSYQFLTKKKPDKSKEAKKNIVHRFQCDVINRVFV